MKRLLVIAITIWVTAVSSASADDLRPSSLLSVPERPESAHSITPELAHRLDDVFRFATTGSHPGCELGIIYHGQLVYTKGYGLADLTTGRSYTSTTPTNIAAVSTQFTACCIALLHLRNRLELDEPVAKYLPELAGFEGITIRHLLFHTSGFPRRHGSLIVTPIGPDYTNQDVLRGLARRALHDPESFMLSRPGAQFSYSNIGYVVLAELIRKVTGQSLRQFASENIFLKLGMKHTQFNENHALPIPDMAHGYKVHGTRDFDRFESAEQTIGDGALVTTVEDLYRWDQNFYHNQLGFGSDLIRLMMTRGPSIHNDGQEPYYGFGLHHAVAEAFPRVDNVWHSGKDSGYEADMRRFPQRSFSIIILGNMDAMHPVALGDKVYAICRSISLQN